jgi:hypothetical protein
LLVLLHIQVVCTRQVRSAGELEGEVGIVEGIKDIGDNRLVVDVDTEDLTLLVDTNHTVSGFVFRSDKDGLARDAVHVDAPAALEVVEMDKAELCDHVDDSVLLGDLHRHREVCGSLRREEDIDVLLGVWGIRSLVVNFDNMQLHEKSATWDATGSSHARTLAPVAVRTAKVKSLVGFW